MTRFLLQAGFVFLFTLAACNKDNDTKPDKPGQNPQKNLPSYLLKEIQWDNGMRSLSHYNNDSTVSHITFALGSAAGQIFYAWVGQQLSEMYDDRSDYTNKFVYDSKGRLAAVNNTKRHGQPALAYSLEYAYDNNDRLQALKYYDVNEAGKQLKETTTYHYGANGNLAKLVTQSGNSVITRTIDAYSDTVSFNYTHYLGASLSENYTLYNYPVLSQLVRLPAKTTKLVKTGTAPEKVDKIDEMTYTITNYRLDKVVTKLTYPDYPVYNQIQEAVYSYY